MDEYAKYMLPAEGYGEGSDSEADEDRQKELEALLYSKVHYAEDLNVEDIEHFPVNEIAPTQPSDVKEVDSGHVTDDGLETLPTIPETIIINESSSEDDGIQVLSTPTIIRNNKRRSQSNNEPICLTSSSSESDSESQTEGEPCEKKNRRSPPVAKSSKSTSDVIVIPNSGPSSAALNPKEVRKGKLTVDTPKREIPKTPKTFVVASDSSSDYGFSTSDEDDDEKTCSLNLNICDSRSKWQGQTKTFKEIIGKSGPNYPKKQLDYPGWSGEMISFYNDINHENVDISNEDIFSRMDPDADWSVNRADRYGGPGSPYQRPRYFLGQHAGKRCNNCNEFGHIARDCTEPEKPMVCYMCGKQGHGPDNCPNSMCLGCWTKGRPYYSYNCDICAKRKRMRCLICGGTGHPASQCSDLWRRYHSTTSEDPGIVKPEVDPHVPDSQMSCSNCLKVGHYPHQCRRARHSKLSPYPEVLKVCSYDEVPIASTSESNYKPMSNRQKKKELKLAKSLYKSHQQKLQPKFPGLSPQFMPRNLEAELSDHGDDIVAALSSSKERWRQKRKTKKAEMKTNGKRKSSVSSADTAAVVFNQSQNQFSNNKHKQQKISFRQRGFISREDRTSSSHIRFQDPTSSPDVIPLSSGKKKKGSKVKTATSAANFSTSKTPPKIGPHKSSPSSGNKIRKHLTPKGTKSTPPQPTTCPKSVYQLTTSLKKEIRRCNSDPRSKKIRKMAQEELNDLVRNMSGSGTGSVPKKERKKFGALLTELKSY